jgi:hypothetical protein
MPLNDMPVSTDMRRRVVLIEDAQTVAAADITLGAT